MPDKKALLVALLGAPKNAVQTKEKEESEESGYEEALKSASDDLLKAIDSKDAAAVASAFRAMHDVCMSGAEEED